MLHLPQPGARGFQGRKRGLGSVGRAVVHEHEFERPAAVQRGRDLVGERPDVLGFVAHRNHHRNGGRRPGQGLGIGHRNPVSSPRSYRPTSLAATDLMRRHDGPGLARTEPSICGTKASPREAYQLRTRMAPKPPTKAAATTSLTKCAVMTTRLSAMIAA